MMTETPVLMDIDTAARAAELFGTLGDPNRVRIIAMLLQTEMNVGDLARAISMSESAVSHQLRILRQMRLVRVDKRGRQVYYALDDEHVAVLVRLVLEHIQHG
jgi:ArsR family transcriptional regulator, lead/cadmium/zinc/bismuth-responsive transcriptional repressor